MMICYCQHRIISLHLRKEYLTVMKFKMPLLLPIFW